jgi:hypothetical protein
MEGVLNLKELLIVMVPATISSTRSPPTLKKRRATGHLDCRPLGDARLGVKAAHVIEVPEADLFVAPIAYAARRAARYQPRLQRDRS